MKLDRRTAALGFAVCLQVMTWACAARSDPPGLPQSTPPIEPAASPSQPSAPATPPATAPLPSAEADPLDCSVVSDPGDEIATVGLTDPVDPSHAPYPTSTSEQLLFRQLYEPLVRIDCSGRVHAALASSWRFDADSQTWTLTLRENAQFSDGTRVTASDVRASWSLVHDADELHAQARRLVEAVVALDDRTLAVKLRSAHADAPRALGHQDLAVAKRVADSPWPLGTRADRARIGAAMRSAPAQSVVTLERDHRPSLTFAVAAGDPRDLLDHGVDLLLTRHPATLAYAATLPHYHSLPLAWQRAHVLLAPGRTAGSPVPDARVRETLARDAVRGESRGAEAPFWWEDVARCQIAYPPAQRVPGPTARFVHDAGDEVARDIAERLVSLARAPEAKAWATIHALLPEPARGVTPRAAGVDRDALARALRAGRDAAYIISIDGRPLDPCGELRGLLERAPWLAPATIVPLVDTRLHAVVRRGRSGVLADWDGGLQLAGSSVPR